MLRGMMVLTFQADFRVGEMVPRFRLAIGNCGIRHVTVPIATRILIANVRHIGVSNICVINLVYFKMQV